MEDLTSDILVNADDGSPLPDLEDREDEHTEPGTGDRTKKKRRGFRGLLKTASLQDRLLDKYGSSHSPPLALSVLLSLIYRCGLL